MRRVVLYKNGVGFFEHLGRVRSSQDVTIEFTSGQLNDVLKSLTTLDLGGGQVAGITYNTQAPVEEQLSKLRLPLAQCREERQKLDGKLRSASVVASQQHHVRVELPARE